MGIDPGSIALKAAMMAAQYALMALNRTEGPRLDNVKTSTADYGTPLTYFWGKRRLECPIIHAEDLDERKVTNKTKGGKYDEWKYYGTWAVAIADHQIEGMSRVWMDKRLVIDLTGVGPVSPLKTNINYRLYKGTEDQLPDPRIEEWCEARYGVDSCPAYRGVSYLVFEDVPLEIFGNRIPMVTVEAISVPAPLYLHEARSTTITGSTTFTIVAGDWAIRYTGNTLEWWDLPTRTNLGTGSGGDGMAGPYVRGLAADGTAYWVRPVIEGVSAPRYLFSSPPLGPVTKIPCDTTDIGPSPTRVIDLPNGTRKVLSATTVPGYVDYATHVSGTDASRDFCLHADGTFVILQQPTGSSNLIKIAGPTALTVAGSVTRGSPSQASICHAAAFNHYFVASDGKFYCIDDTTGAIKATGVMGNVTLPFTDPYAKTFWDGYNEYSLEDGSLVRSLNPFDWVVETSGNTTYIPSLHGAIGFASTTARFRYFDRVGDGGPTLQTVIEDVAERSGVTVTASACDQIIQGWSVTQGTGKDWLEPLLNIHDVDARPHDFTLEFIKRDGASRATITTDKFAREGDEPRYTATRRQDTDLPLAITVNFADQDKDQQANNVIARRNQVATDSKRQTTIDLSTYVATPTVAQQLTDRLLRRKWNERDELVNALSPQYLAYEPGDRLDLNLDGVLWTCRLERMTITRGAIKCEWKRDPLGLSNLGSGTGAPMDGRNEQVIPFAGAIKGFVLDTTLPWDGDNSVNPLLYYGAGSYGTFLGAYVANFDGEEYSLWNSVDSDRKAVWGTCLGALAAPGTPWCWDRKNSVTVRAFGTLTSCTEADIDADPTRNLAAIGAEWVNFTTATLNGDGTYTLSGFKRGRRGTEWACGTAAAGAFFVLASSLQDEGAGLSDIGTTLTFKAQAVGRDLSGAETITIPFAGNSLKPYAPASVKAVFNGTDWTFTVIRRTRVGGAWVGGTTIPLAENSEAYSIDIYSGASVVRTLTLTGTNSAVWTNAQQVSDFGATQTSKPTLKAYQVSDAVGRGFALAA